VLNSVYYRSHLKNRILVQVHGGIEFQPADILKYFEELEFGPNTEIGTKGLFEMASIFVCRLYIQYDNLRKK
jgi:hypothetical protein